MPPPHTPASLANPKLRESKTWKLCMTDGQREGHGAGDFSKTFTAIAFFFILLTSPTYETSRIMLVNCER